MASWLWRHLAQAGGGAEVAVDLKWRVEVEQIRGGALPEQGPEIVGRLRTVAEACPEVDDPGAAPTGVASAAGQASFERHPGGAGELRRAPARDLPSRVQREQV